MEEVVIVILQVLVEVGVQVLGSVGVDYAASRAKGDDDGGCGWLTLFAVFGGVLGGISLVVFPNVLLPTAGLRLANLAASPLLAGGASYGVARSGALAGPASTHFWRGFV